MSPRPRPVSPRLAGAQWLAAWAVVLHAVWTRYAPDASLGAEAAVFLAAGAIFRTSPVRVATPRGRWWEALVGAGSLLALGLALHGARAAVFGEDRLSFWGLPWILLVALLAADLRAWPRLRRLVGVEWMKARRSRLFRAGLLSAALVTLLAGLLHERLPNETGWTLACTSLGTGQWVAEVFVLVLGAVALAGEATGGTTKMMLPHAYRRSDWILAKGIVLLLVSIVFAVVVAVVALGHAALAEGLGDVTRTLEPMFGETEASVETFQEADAMRDHLQDALVAGLAALAATALLGLFLSSLFDGVVAALCVAFLLFAGLKFADVVFSLPREALQGIYAWYPGELRELTSKLGRALNERWDEALLPAGLRLSLLTGAVAALAGIAVFSRRDLQV